MATAVHLQSTLWHRNKVYQSKHRIPSSNQIARKDSNKCFSHPPQAQTGQTWRNKTANNFLSTRSWINRITLTVQKTDSISWQLSTEVEVLGQCGGDGWHLLLLIAPWIQGERLKVQRHLVVDPRHDLHQLQLAAVLLQHLAQRLHEPGACALVPPGVVAW